MKNILVAYDGSETSKRAVDVAAEIVASFARADASTFVLDLG